MAKILCLMLAALIVSPSVVPVRAAEAPGGAADAATLDTLLGVIRANRKAMVAVNLKLSDAEAAAFWPVYDRYQNEINTLGDRLVTVIEDYSASFKDLSNEKAVKLAQDYLGIEADRVKVRQTYLDEMAKILPGRTVARFFQIENKMDAVMRYDLAATIPVVDEQDGQTK